MNLYPIYLKLIAEPCLVIGGGEIAERKIESLVDAGAVVTIISPEVTTTLNQFISKNNIKWIKREYLRGDITNYKIVIASTNKSNVNEEVYKEASEKGILVNCVDIPDKCNFYVPAIVSKGFLQLAISTNGNAPTLARELKKYFEGKLYPEIEHDLDLIAKKRKELNAQPYLNEQDKKDAFTKELMPLVTNCIDKIKNK